MTIGFPSQLGNVVYEYDYFCGSQVLVYFEHVLVDDIVRLAWGTSQNRQPIYGYASQYWNAVASGHVVGGGSFWIAFKEAAYIPLILSQIAEFKSSNIEDSIYISSAQVPTGAPANADTLVGSANLWEGTNQEGGARTTNRVAMQNDIQRLMQSADSDPTDAEAQTELTRYALNLAALPDRNFEDAAEMFEDAVWYSVSGSPGGGRQQARSGNWAGGAMSEEQVLAHRRADQYPPFDIMVTFGEMNNPAANHTLKKLTDVIITDTRFVTVETTGEPIAVQYDFIFRNEM